MPRKTEGIQILVQEVISTIPQPYGRDIILKVCEHIEGNPDWRGRYEILKNQLIKDVANNWIGKYTKQITGLNSLNEVKAPQDNQNIISFYTELE